MFKFSNLDSTHQSAQKLEAVLKAPFP